MKKVISLMIVTIFVFISAVSVFAVDNTVTFKTVDTECKKGRLFTVDIIAKSSDKLSAVLFKFSYDRSLIEYRSVSTTADSMVYGYDTGSTVNVSYLCKDGKNISDDTVIFTLKFKALEVGKTDLLYTAYDCVNSAVQDLQISQCTSGTLSIKEQGLELKNDADNLDVDESEIIYDDSKDGVTSTLDELGILNGKFSDNGIFMLVVGILSGLAVAVLCFMLYLFIIKRKIKSKAEKENH